MTFYDPYQGVSNQCAKSAYHCWHQIPYGVTAGAPSFGQQSVCCHCDAKIGVAVVTQMLHGPHAPGTSIV